ncbi:ATP-dependent DNA helicase RecG [Patulibacter americanus]|uniref:ATP-dependent DNA helicase RecG n=1 Tax=Patulibacter americanus TaxID=588672 RepID=UPI0003B3818B|nr:ATP-dependent DNA helicase RecG [Patulibacter americanus]
MVADAPQTHPPGAGPEALEGVVPPAVADGPGTGAPPAAPDGPAARAFATAEPLDTAALRAAPVRTPRPSRWERASGFSGKKALKAAGALGIDTVGGLLQHLPVESGRVGTIGGLRQDERTTLLVQVQRIASRPVHRRGMRPLVEALVTDGSGVLRIAFFNQPWLLERYPPGTRLLISGTSKGPGRFSVAAHAPSSDPLPEPAPRLEDGVVPDGPDPDGAADGDGGGEEETAYDGPSMARYPATDGLTSIEILARVRDLQDDLHEAVDPLPARLRARQRLPARVDALRAAHLGDHEAGRRRLAFDELLLGQLDYLRRRRLHGKGRPATALDGPTGLTDRWVAEALPFRLTGDQEKAVATNARALAGTEPLQRLLMGEVGSGKTVVALHAMLRAVECGHQAALMAPTETLAEQHFRTLQKLLGDVLVPVELLTGSTSASRRRTLLARLASGELPLLVGTHALIEDPVVFRSLAVAVVDEQHRFGVRQRSALDRKAPVGHAPHLLHMTATPIPRTMALLAYGDLDVVALRQLPAGRKPISTYVCASDRERARAYERIREEVGKGRQAFVVCPLVDDSEALDARSAVAEHERLSTGELKELRVELLHGQMRPAEKQAVMERFAAGAADVLVATTVIEVGIDVPNATVMLIENAERFGISQLHQLRGRVGRGGNASTCLLFGPKSTARLRALAAHTDGFALSEVDLQLRGEGELLGTRQSGVARFATARLPDDADLLLRARDVAEELHREDPDLEHPVHAPLRDALLERLRAQDDLEAIPA